MLSYSVRSSGLRADVTVGQEPEGDAADGRADPAFITDRLLGYAGTGGNMHKIEVDHPGLATIGGRVQHVAAPRLEELGLLTAHQSAQPYSALYVREAVFRADIPTRESALV
jgi:hypothetical protein